MATLTSTVSALASGVASVAGVGKAYRIEFTDDGGGSWALGDTFTLTFLHNITGLIEEVGFGIVSGVEGNFCLTYDDKVYVLGGPIAYFSELTNPASFNAPEGIGNGYVNIVNYYSTPEPLQAVAAYQGGLAFFSRTTTQIWDVAEDPAAWSKRQTLPNIGTVAPRSVQSLGDLEVFFLADSGLRSLRARETVLNAVVTDIGSPTDQPVQTQLQGMTDAEKALSCGVIEPTANRYWCYVDGIIWVLSYFPSNKIQAWSQYLPTYQDGSTQVPFVPSQFVAHGGQVYARAGDSLMLYGGSDDNTYDNAACVVEIPWLSFKKPATDKDFDAIDAAFAGAWRFETGVDPQSGVLAEALVADEATFRNGVIPVQGTGTHVKMRATTTGSTAAVLSSMIIHYELNDAT